MKLQKKFFFSIGSLIVLTVLLGGTLQIIFERKLIKIELENNRTQTTQRLARVAEEALLQNDLVVVNFLKTLESERGFKSAAVLDESGLVRLHSDVSLIGRDLTSPNEKRAQNSIEIFMQTYVDRDNSEVLDYAFPVFLSKQRTGSVRTFWDQSVLQSFLNKSLKESLQRWGLVVLLSLIIGFVGAYALARMMVKPIQIVMGGMQEVAKGKLDPISFPERNDELGLMGQEINKTIAKLKELDEMKREFVAGVTHELRSPLTAIDSFAGMVLNEKEPNPSRLREYMITIQNNSKRLMHFVDKLLSTAKIESHREVFDFTQFDINKTIEEVVKLYQPLASEVGLDIKTNHTSAETFVWADREKVVHIMNNLLSNGLKFTKKGGISISTSPKDDDFILVTIADTGVGIPAQDRDNIFEKFFRSKNSAKDVKGTGLGLAIVKGLIEGQGGKIWVEDNKGGGTVFLFTLPT